MMIIEFYDFYDLIFCFSGDAPKCNNVVWDTSPVKTRNWVLESLPDYNVSQTSEDFSTDLRLVNREENKQMGGVYVVLRVKTTFIAQLLRICFINFILMFIFIETVWM